MSVPPGAPDDAAAADVYPALVFPDDVFATPRGPRERGVLLHVGLAAAAHLVVLGLSFQAAMACDPDQQAEERVHEMRALIVHDDAQEDLAHDAKVVTDTGEGRAHGSTRSARAGDGRAGGGARAAGVEGKLGDADARSAKQGRYAVPEQAKQDPRPALSREEALIDAASFGAIGLLGQGPSVPVSAAFGSDLGAHGDDSFAARGAMWAKDMGSAQGAGGLGLSGAGEGGGGRGEGIGLGAIGTLGHLAGAAGAGTGGDGLREGGGRGPWGARSHVRRPPRWWSESDRGIDGKLPGEVVRRIIRQNFGRFRLCYEDGLRANNELSGRVTTRFVIGRDGAVTSVSDGGSDLPDHAVIACVGRAFQRLSFPQPESGIVRVTYPISFSPAG
jgi:hypothetical protein